MRIVHIVPGTGDTFYCQNCLRDQALVGALRALGHDVILVPLYLPLPTDADDAAGAEDRSTPVFFGALNVYLQQKTSLFRRTPRWIDRVLDSRRLLTSIAKRASSTQARGLEKMTLSMLDGQHGNQAKELDRLISWLAGEARPDIVHLSNALLAGLAKGIRAELDVPLVCSLQDEHTWIDQMQGDYARLAWQVLSEKVADVDAFVPVSRYYGEMMQKRMHIPPEKIHVVYPGIALEGYEAADTPVRPPVVGYLSRLSQSLGLDILVEAFIRLKSDARLETLRLRATGGRTGRDGKFIARTKKRLAALGIADDVRFEDDFDRAARQRFFRSLSVFSVPAPGGEAFALYIIESLASGVPVVEPRAGAFTEIVEATGGGIICEPDDANALAEVLSSLLLDPERARELGRRARDVVRQRFSIASMAREMVKVYEDCAGTRRPANRGATKNDG